MAKAGVAKKSAAKKTTAKKTASKAAVRKSPLKKAPAGKATAANTPAAKSAAQKSIARAKKTRDPEGGLTQAGRDYFKKKEGANLKPGVKGKADTPEKQKRKGSFLRRHFANPRGPMERDGEPTRLALSAHAWGEPVPGNAQAAKKLAKKGTKLLKQYQEGKTRED